MSRIKGEVLHNGLVVPVEIEINEDWSGDKNVIVHVPEDYIFDHSLLSMISFTADLKGDAKPLYGYN